VRRPCAFAGLKSHRTAQIARDGNMLDALDEIGKDMGRGPIRCGLKVAMSMANGCPLHEFDGGTQSEKRKARRFPHRRKSVHTGQRPVATRKSGRRGFKHDADGNRPVRCVKNLKSGAGWGESIVYLGRRGRAGGRL